MESHTSTWKNVRYIRENARDGIDVDMAVFKEFPTING